MAAPKKANRKQATVATPVTQTDLSPTPPATPPADVPPGPPAELMTTTRARYIVQAMSEDEVAAATVGRLRSLTPGA